MTTLFEAVRRELDTIRLPPNLSIQCQHEAEGWSSPPSNDIVLLVESRWPDSRNPAEMIKVGQWQLLSAVQYDNFHPDDRQRFVRTMIAMTVRKAWMHELDEWLQFDGVHYRDPHPLPR